MLSTAGAFVVAVFLSLGDLFLTVFNLITLGDLEVDYINAQEACKRLNVTFVPETIMLGVLALLTTLYQEWLSAIIPVAWIAWNVHRYRAIPAGNGALYDAQDILNGQKLRVFRKEFAFKLGASLVLFLLYIYKMILYLVA